MAKEERPNDLDRRPNIIVFITDDQGYGDLSCMGTTDFKTPHLDKLAQSGVRFTDFYSNSPVCSPSRASLLTGRYPAHASVRSILGGGRETTGLSPRVPTMAEALAKEGYRTGMFGKWHLGLAEGSRPEDHGFDKWMGFLAGCIDYYSHIFYWGMAGGRMDPVHDLWEDGEEIYRNGEYFTELITEEATDFIRQAAQGEDPFFLYLPYNAPHYPMHAPKKYRERFPDLPWDRGIMAAMLSAVDDGVGAILDELERDGVRENTCIFFQSDNGPSRETRNWLDGTEDPYYGGTAGGLKGHKFSLYEGGIRVPGIISWPKEIPAAQVIEEPVAAMDLFPTLLQAAGGDPEEYELDGEDILPVVSEGGQSPHEEIFWEMGEQTAIRQGDWKLVLNGQLVEGTPPEDEVHLANLEEDMAEEENLKEKRRQKAQELKGKAEKWRERIERKWESEWKYEANGRVPRD